jgi:hypothetical protein
LPGGSLLFAGGDDAGPDLEEVVRVDARREYAATYLPPMFTARSHPCAVYHDGFLYICGGNNGMRRVKKCERDVCAWEVLPDLPYGYNCISGVVLDSSLYTLGGYSGRDLDLIHKLSLDTLTWELLEVALPEPGRAVPCFRDTQVYLVINSTLYSFTPSEVLLVKELSGDIKAWGGPSHYSRGTLYCSSYNGAARTMEIGSLESL